MTDGTRPVRYVLVAVDSPIVCEEEEARLYDNDDDDALLAAGVGGGSEYDVDLDRALDVLGLKVPVLPDWLWFRTR